MSLNRDSTSTWSMRSGRRADGPLPMAVAFRPAHDRDRSHSGPRRAKDGSPPLADTGAGTAKAAFELLLDEHDCLLCGGKAAQTVGLGGAYAGSFPRYVIRVEIPKLNFDARVFAVGVPIVPTGLDGIACFRFVNRFTYGNFGDPAAFGLEI